MEDTQSSLFAEKSCHAGDLWPEWKHDVAGGSIRGRRNQNRGAAARREKRAGSGRDEVAHDRTKKGTACRGGGRQRHAGVFFHSAGRVWGQPFRDRLAQRYHVSRRVHGMAFTGRELLEDMLDWHSRLGCGRRVGLSRPHLSVTRWALSAPRLPDGVLATEQGEQARVAARGDSDGEHPIPDLFALLPFKNAERSSSIRERRRPLTGGADLSDMTRAQGLLSGLQRRLHGADLASDSQSRTVERLYAHGPTLLVGALPTADRPAYAARLAGADSRHACRWSTGRPHVP